MASPIVPPQSAQVPPCPVCQRPIYPDLEHNPLCAAIANLQSLVFKAAGTLEEDQAERWADLHQRMTGLHAEIPEEVKNQLRSLEERIGALEAAGRGHRAPPPAAGAEETQEEKKPGQESASPIVT
jgi:hypothetical protein